MGNWLRKINWLSLLAAAISILWIAYAGIAVMQFYREQERHRAPLDKTVVASLFDDFQNSEKKLFSLEMDALLRPQHPIANSLELLDPSTALPQAYRYERQALQKIFIIEKKCQGLAESHEPALQKYAQWVNFLCHGKKLPSDFLKKPPFTTPQGGSWAKLLWEKKIISASEALPHLHFLELYLLPNEASRLPPELLRISPETLSLILAKTSLVHTQELLFRIDSAGILSGYLYSAWNQFLAKNLIRADSIPEENCPGILSEGLCWQRSIAPSEKSILPHLLLTLLVLLAWVLLLLWQRFQYRKKGREERELMIQTLAHELRHPAASIQLSLESFRRDFDGLPEVAKDEFLRMTDQVQKLSRVIHASRSYLQSSHEGGTSFHFNFQEMDSFQDFIDETINPYQGKVSLEFIGGDGACRVDAYWTGLCITNLIKNALIHGKQPISLRAEFGESEFKVAVTDSGESILNLEEMLAPFRKREGSPGMGLGLSLTSRIAQRMGGKLHFKNKPTSFILVLPRFCAEDKNAT